MVEYAALLAHNGLASLQSLGRTAEVWLSRVNWELAGYAALVLIVLRFVTWTLKPR